MPANFSFDSVSLKEDAKEQLEFHWLNFVQMTLARLCENSWSKILI